MREYKIVRSLLGWNISRKKQIGRLILLQYLNGHGNWTSNRGAAKTFYTRESAEINCKNIKKKEEQKPD